MPVAKRHRNAARRTTELEVDGRKLRPVEIVASGNKIAATFWGGAWCKHLERCSDFSNRLPRGRTYVRNGSVIDLQIAPGQVTALVSGSEIYDIKIRVQPLDEERWQKLRTECAGGIDSLVELLQGRFSNGVMEVLCRPETGMFPEPGHISMACSCPDWAVMCKHVAAVLYGIGARLDVEPELLFTLRKVDHTELISATDGGIAAATSGDGAEELACEDLGAIFGIELAEPEPRAANAGRAEAAPADQTAPTKKASPRAKPPREAPGSRAVRDPWITAAELRQRGVPNHVAQAWLNQGLVSHSGTRGIYVRTKGVEALVKRYLAAKPSNRRTR